MWILRRSALGLKRMYGIFILDHEVILSIVFYSCLVAEGETKFHESSPLALILNDFACHGILSVFCAISLIIHHDSFKK